MTRPPPGAILGTLDDEKTEKPMGLGDNRRTPKMRRKKAQEKLKSRIKRRRDEGKKARAATKAPAPPAKKGKSSPSTASNA